MEANSYVYRSYRGETCRQKGSLSWIGLKLPDFELKSDFELKLTEFDLPNGSYSVWNIQDYVEFIFKRHQTLTTILPIHVYIIIINNRLVFEIKDYKARITNSWNKKIVWCANNKTKNWQKKGEKVPSLEVVEVVLVQCNLVDKKHHRKSEVLYLFTPNKSYAYLLNVEPSNLVFLKTCNTEFDEIILTFFDQNSRSLEMEYKVNLALLINKLKLCDIL